MTTVDEVRFRLWAIYMTRKSKLLNFCNFIRLAFSDAAMTDFIPTGDESGGRQLEVARVYRVTKIGEPKKCDGSTIRESPKLKLEKYRFSA